MTDKFPMHSDFPMDEAYSGKARERGFDREHGLQLFEEWRNYWTDFGKEHPGDQRSQKTARGWLMCWDNNIKRKAKNGCARSKPRQRFQFRNEPDALPPDLDLTRRWVGGRAYTWPDALEIRARLNTRTGISADEQQVLREWGLK